MSYAKMHVRERNLKSQFYYLGRPKIVGYEKPENKTKYLALLLKPKLLSRKLKGV